MYRKFVEIKVEYKKNRSVNNSRANEARKFKKPLWNPSSLNSFLIKLSILKNEFYLKISC
jgi:hypothetical protein